MSDDPRRARMRRRTIALGALVVVALLVFVLVYFEPQKLFIDERVDEALPGGQPLASSESSAQPSEPAPSRSATSATSAPPSPSEQRPEVLARGEFHGQSHEGSGTALLVRLPDDRVIVRFEDLNVENGPDLRVYLSAAEADAPEHEFIADFVDLGALKGNIGNQNYDVPAGTDLDRYRSVTVWCREFSVGFAAAPLDPATT